jgi:iron complex transport system substrate-binding protein
MRVLLILLTIMLLGGCSDSSAPVDPQTEIVGKAVPIAHAKTFKVVEREGYRIVDIEASIVTWGGAAGGPKQRARLLLVPREAKAPPFTGDLSGAVLIRTPVQRIAVNDQPNEAVMRALGVADRLVAVGGHTSYDDAIRARVRSGQIAQIGYGWHQVPTLDALINARPDVFFARMADLTHTKHLERIQKLGIPVVPVFMEAEPHYLGRVDWALLAGMLTGREREAQAFVAEVNSEVTRLKALAARQPQRSLLNAWYASSGDQWSVTHRNAEGALIRDANAEVVLGKADDPRLDYFSRISTEQLLEGATHADCWIIGDPLSANYTDVRLLGRFKAYQENCLYRQHGRKHPTIDSWELWEMGFIRPDWQLADIIKIAHPQLRDGNFHYHAQVKREAK